MTDRAARRLAGTLALIAWMLIGHAVAAEPTCEAGCVGGVRNLGYGDGSSGDFTVPPGQTFELPLGMNYRNFTISSTAVLDTRGRTLRVCGKLLNYGTITDLLNGGNGGDGGGGGLGSDPDLTSPPGCALGPLFCRDGDPGNDGGAGLISGAGAGGHGGGGGGGGGSARRNAIVDANGGDGGSGGHGGDGGGAVRIYTYCLENRGTISADGGDGAAGGDAPDVYEDCGAEYFRYPGLYDLAGGGGGGGGGGCGGGGGTIEIFFESQILLGQIHANAGLLGSGGDGGEGGTQHPDPHGPLLLGSTGEEGSGCDGAGPHIYGGNGGHGEITRGSTSGDGQDGDDGNPGVAGQVRLLGPAPPSWTDVEHYELAANINPAGLGHLSGDMVMRILSRLDGVRYFRFRLDSEAFTNPTVMWSPTVSGWQPAAWAWRDDGITAVVDLGQYIPANQRFYVRVQYTGVPRQNPGPPWVTGLLFQHHGLSLRDVIVTDVEPWYAYLWVPTKDDLGQWNCDKASADLYITVPSGMQVVSQGILKDVNQNTYHWRTNHGTAAYLFSIAASDYDVIPLSPQACSGTNVSLYLYPEDNDLEKYEHWLPVCEMMSVFGSPSKLGPYPFANEKYAIYEWNSRNGSMEHQTATGQNANWSKNAGGTTFNAAEMTTAHELSHQWIGDSLSVSTWSDDWIKEGFASYAPALWLESQADRPDMPSRIRGNPGEVLKYYVDLGIGPDVSDPDPRSKIFGRPVYVSNASVDDSVFYGPSQYRRAPWVYHMLRHIVDPIYDGAQSPRFYSIIRRMLGQNDPEGCKTTDGLRLTAEDICREQAVFAELGRCVGYPGPTPPSDLIWFWGQPGGVTGWVYNAGGPEYRYRWDYVAEDHTRIRYRIKQVQDRWPIEDDRLFTMPIDLLISGDNTSTRVRAWNDARVDSFDLSSSYPITGVDFDPDHWILSRSRGWAFGGRLTPVGQRTYVSLPAGAITDGERVASTMTIGGQARASMWSPDPWNGMRNGLNDLGSLGGASCREWGVNNRGEIVGDADLVGGGFGPFIWLPRPEYGFWAGMNRLGTYPAGSQACARDINDLGDVVGWVNERAVLWAYDRDAGGWRETTLPNEGEELARAWAINEARQIAGMLVTAGDTTAVVWEYSDSLGSYLTNRLGPGGAYCISDFAIAGGQSQGNPYLWEYRASGEAWQPISLPVRSGGVVFAVNRDGEAVGMSGGHAVRWRDGVAEDLNDAFDGFPPCVQLTAAWDINDAGRILVYGMVQGSPRLFILADEGDVDADQDLIVDNCGLTSGADPAKNGFKLELKHPRIILGSDQGEIAFTVDKARRVKVAVYDISGREVMVLVDRRVEPGEHRVPVQGGGGRQNRLASGVYFVRLSSDGFASSRRMLIVR
jgi:hypothetical protein